MVGIDISQEAIDFCMENYALPHVEFKRMDFRKMVFENDSFDCVVSFETLEHIVEQEKFLQEVKRILRPGGLFLVSTPDKDHYCKGFNESESNPFHKKEFSRREFETLLKQHFRVDRMYGQVTAPHSENVVSPSCNEPQFKIYLRQVVVQNSILYKLFVIFSGKKKRYSPRPLDGRSGSVYLIGVCVNGVVT